MMREMEYIQVLRGTTMNRKNAAFLVIAMIALGLAACAAGRAFTRGDAPEGAGTETGSGAEKKISPKLRAQDSKAAEMEAPAELARAPSASPALAPAPAPDVESLASVPVPVPGQAPVPAEEAPNTDEYNEIVENVFKDPRQEPLSTFSIDVDKASYANVRNYLNEGSLPPPDAVRIEELVNYFAYDYPEPKGEHPFSITTEYADSPWKADSKLFLIGIQGKRLDFNSLKPCNLVFLIDTSGSMSDQNKLPLLKEALALLVKNLSARDRIAIVAYAGSAGIVLDSTRASEADTIIAAMDALASGGSTAGGEGIELAYLTAKKNYLPGGNNRVILCTDGDFNVGRSSTGDLVDLITEKRKEDIYLTICGFGMGNYKDGRMEEISKAGNGNYFYIDSRKEAEKVFVKEMRANMFTIAKDVKIQLEFNPKAVQAYRLIGYENRLMAAEDFADDTKDAGELGPGHTVTALYEILPAPSASGDLLTVKFRYKPIKSDVSIPIELAVGADSVALGRASPNFRFAASVAEFGMLLRESKFAGNASWTSLIELAGGARGQDEEGYRAEFIGLAQKAKKLSGE